MIPRADPETLPYVRPKVERFLEFCRNRAAEHNRPEPAIEFVPRKECKINSTEMVIAWLKEHPDSTYGQIMDAMNMTRATIVGIVYRNPHRIEQAGTVDGDRTQKLWRVRE